MALTDTFVKNVKHTGAGVPACQSSLGQKFGCARFARCRRRTRCRNLAPSLQSRDLSVV